ncbi:antibiotic biosynthesis monooxygenase family protein [Solibacillus sp. FSL H8-0538]|uniref:antibiotic biosynthesis monooxygenase family protein n=1 Tax=Solibacillus sp. FSL H8-0538 TaxID=2921400 RepID=UPI0030F62B46
MYIYLTSGTADYMEKLVEKYTKENLLILHGNGNSVLLHESEKKSVFAMPRKFEVIDGVGDLQQKGFFVFHNIPVTEEGRPIFEKQFLEQTASLKSDSSLIAYRFLRPVKAETYIILTQWPGPASFEVWKNSSHYKNNIAPLIEESTSTVQAIFHATAYTTTYSAPPKK